MDPRKKLALAGLLVLGAALVWFFWPGGRNLSAAPHAVPRSAVGTETVAVARFDVATYAGVDGGSVKAIHDALGQADPETAGLVRNLLRALAEQGVTQVVLPVNVGPKGGEGVGIYLGGEMKASAEEMETAILRSPTSRLFRAATLLTAVVPCGDGWRFWGVGTGENGAQDGAVADRYERSFRSTDKALLQVVVLGSGGTPGAGPPPKPADPRIVRQLRRIQQSAEQLDYFCVALEPVAAKPGEFTFASGAHFLEETAARRFVASWGVLADDLSAVLGPVGEPGLLDRALGPVIRVLLATVPRVEGRVVRWGPPAAPAPK